MNKDTLLLLLLALILLAGMLYTLLAGDTKSRHGYGLQNPAISSPRITSNQGRPFNTGNPFFPQA